MTEGIGVKRLSKVAREFNIGTHTIVDFLAKKGMPVENNPNAKISDNAYDLLVKEFLQEKKFKEATLGKPLFQPQRGGVQGAETKPDNEDTALKTFLGGTKEPVLGQPAAKSAEPVISVKDEVKLTGPKIVGKVEEPKSEEPTQAPKPPAVAEVKEVKEAKEAPEKSEEKIIQPEPPAPRPEPVEAAVSLPTPNPTKQETQGLKILGKIEIETAKSKKAHKPMIEAPEAPPKPKAPPQQDQPALIAEPEKQRDDAPQEENGIYKPERTKLTGITLLGSMELPGPKETEKKPAEPASTDANKSKRRKRKRIHKKEKPAGTEVVAQKPAPKPGTGKPEPRTAPHHRHPRYDQPKVEISDEDIQKQIRETLAALSNVGGKSKGSKYRRIKRDILTKKREKDLLQESSDEKVLKVTEFIPASELASLMNINVSQVIATCMSLGLFISINQRLDAETITIVASEFGFDVEFVKLDEQVTEQEIDNEADLRSRAPIVTVMGHVDHGKTSLLDRIRRTNVIAGEAGGITQHIGAYSVVLDSGKTITFLDTPGHEAFTAMRARGAKITDVAIIVVAADDNVMPQTKEAINHAQAANVPIVFAINKIDKPSANPEKVKEELSKMNILVEDWGGKYQSQEVSAKQGIKIDLLLEKVLLEAELLDLKSNPSRKAVGAVIESSLDKGRGYVATMLVQNGTLNVGDIVVAGIAHGKVKAMFNERGQKINTAGPSTPVLILGLDGAPQAGDAFQVVENESDAKAITTRRQQIFREQGLRTQKHITLDEIGRRIAIGDFKELNIIVKGDFDGSVEALSDSLLKLTTQEVQVNIIHKAVGPITEGDVLLASASNAIVVGFQVRPSLAARKLAEQEQIDIRLYSIIYNAINEIKSAIEGMLSPEIAEKVVANIEIREVFKITKVGTVAGCFVLDGKINRNTSIRLIRDGIVVYTGKLGSLKRFKDDVKEVSAGYECGLNIDRFNDLKVGDIIEAFETTEIARKIF